jgi:hypothetical protein
VVKAQCSTLGLPPILCDLRAGEVSGIPGVVVKYVDIGRNTSGVGGSLDSI